MFLKRLKRHIREQDWFAVGVDLLIVFLAVFVGLQADNWNQDRVTKSNAKLYYARLIQDLRAEETSRFSRIAYYQQVLRHGEAALQSLSRPGNRDDEQLLVDLYQATQLWNYTPQRATYDELLAIGIANAIPDAVIRGRLANYYLGLTNSGQIQQEQTPYRQNIRRFMPHDVQSILREKCGDIFESREDGVVLISLPADCHLGLDETSAESAVRATARYEDLQADLTHRLGDLENKIRNLNNYIPPTQQIIAQLVALTE
jgi:hypothetical protein